MNIPIRWAVVAVAVILAAAVYFAWSSQKQPELPKMAPGSNARQQDNPEDRPPAGH